MAVPSRTRGVGTDRFHSPTRDRTAEKVMRGEASTRGGEA